MSNYIKEMNHVWFHIRHLSRVNQRLNLKNLVTNTLLQINSKFASRQTQSYLGHLLYDIDFAFSVVMFSSARFHLQTMKSCTIDQTSLKRDRVLQIKNNWF